MSDPRETDLRIFDALDFSPLDTSGDVRGPVAHRLVRALPNALNVAVMVLILTSGSVAVFAVPSFVAAGAGTPRGDFYGLCAVVAVAVLTGGILFLRGWNTRFGRRLVAINSLLPGFAAANRMTFERDVVETTLPAAAGQEAAVQRIRQRIRPDQDAGWPPFEIGTRFFHRPVPADFVPTHKRPYPVTLDYGWYAAVPLPRRLPHIALLRRDERSDTPLDPRAQYSMGLEFDRTFTLLCPPGYERDALYLFTPDVLAAMLDDAGSAQWGAEVLDDRLFFRFPQGSMPLALFEEDLRRAFLLIERTATELAKQAENYRDERTGDRELNLVAAPGRRLRTRPRPSAYIAGIGMPSLILAPFAMLVIGNLVL